MTYFTGIDVSLRSVSICIVDEHGEGATKPRRRRSRGQLLNA
jgi:hypothetical protein